MISMYDRITVRNLKDRGMGIRKIAREAGLSRNTVRRYLRDLTISAYPARPSKPNDQLAPFIPNIEKMLTQELIGSRIITELRKLGYCGSTRTFYRQLARLVAARQPSQAIERFETPPGHQGQYDWSEYTVSLGNVVTKVYLHSLILCYSRYQHLTVSLHIGQSAIFDALEESFAFFGGVPRDMLFDNPRAIVHHPRPNLAFNPRLLELARFYRFRPQACWTYRPQTKGKVERPFQMIEEHFIKGKRFADWRDLTQRLAEFATDTLNVRIHGTTGERPRDRLQTEQPLLYKLPATRFISSSECIRKVSMDCLVSYGGSRYSVPWAYAGKQVWLRITRDLRLETLAPDGKLLARHGQSRHKGGTVMEPEHYRGLRDRPDSKKRTICRVFGERFPETVAGEFLTRLLAQYKFNATDQSRRILALAENHPRAAMLMAFGRALEYNTYSYRFLQGLLNRQAEDEASCPGPGLMSQDRVLPGLDITRGLGRYQQMLEEGGHDRA